MINYNKEVYTELCSQQTHLRKQISQMATLIEDLKAVEDAIILIAQPIVEAYKGKFFRCGTFLFYVRDVNIGVNEISLQVDKYSTNSTNNYNRCLEVQTAQRVAFTPSWCGQWEEISPAAFAENLAMLTHRLTPCIGGQSSVIRVSGYVYVPKEV